MESNVFSEQQNLAMIMYIYTRIRSKDYARGIQFFYCKIRLTEYKS
jgi:hypothetical protein